MPHLFSYPLAARARRFAVLLLLGCLSLGSWATTATKITPEMQKLMQKEVALEERGDLVGAVAVCQQILKIAPKDAGTMNVIAGLHGQMNRPEDQIVWANKALAIDKTLWAAYVNRGNAEMSLGEMVAAKASFKQASQLAPNDPIPEYSLGVWQEALGNLKAATKHYERAVRLDPEFENGLFNLAAAYANANRFDEAVALLDRLLKKNPAARDAREMRRQILEEKASLSRR